MEQKTEQKKGGVKPAYVIGGVVAIIGLLAIIFFWGRSSFRKNATETLSHATELKTLEFESSLGEQLTLVRQMIKSPSITEYLENPTNPVFAEMAMQEFGAFQNSFLSKSIFWVSDANHEFWQNMEYMYDLDPEDPDSYWYKMTMYETEEYNFNINYNPDLNVTMLWVNAVIRNSAGTPVGIAGTGIPLTDFITSMYSGLDKDITMYLFNDNLIVTGAADQSILADQIELYTLMPELQLTDAVPSRMTVFTGPKNQFVLAPLDLVSWHMAMAIPFSLAEFFKNALTPSAICLVIIIVSLTVGIAINLIASLNILNSAVQELSSGNADLTKRISLGKTNTLGIIYKLVDSLNLFIQKLQDIVGTVKQSNTSLVTTGDKLRDSTQDTSASITQIIANIQSMGQNIQTQATSVDGTASAVNEISANIDSLNKMIGNQVGSIADASSAVQQMIGNINSVNNSVNVLAQSYTTLQNHAQQGVATQQAMNEKILQIREQSEMLKNANQVISSIAQQTNLLAMNAAIEAAHAGEAGKGFSVVADEIRKLSENSSQQTKTIGAQLKTIQNSVAEIVTVSEESRNMFNSVSEDITQTSQLVKEINTAMQEQKSGSEQISKSLKLLNDTSGEVKSSSQEMTNGNKVILSEIENLENATVSMKNGMEEMLTGAQKINETGSMLSELSAEMDASIANIGKELDQFKV